MSGRRIGRRMLAAALVAVVCLWGLHAACKRIYWYDYIGVRETLQDIPGVRLDSIRGFDDGIHFKVIGAEVSLLSAPTKTIYFRSPTAWELRHGTCLNVYVAEYGFYAITPEGQALGLELGSDGVFSNLLPFEVTSAEEVVRRYDDIIAALGRLPQSGLHRGKDGRLYRYEIRPSTQSAPRYDESWSAYQAALRER